MPFFDKLGQISKALRDAEEERRAISESILEALADSIFVVDETGNIVMVNQAAIRLTGYSSEELLGMSIEQLVPTGRRDIHRKHRSHFKNQPTERPMGAGMALSILCKG